MLVKLNDIGYASVIGADVLLLSFRLFDRIIVMEAGVVVPTASF